MRKSKVIFLIFCLITALTLLCLQGVFYQYLKSRGIRFADGDPKALTMARLQSVPGTRAHCVIMGSSMTERFSSAGDILVIGMPGNCFTSAWSRYIPECRIEGEKLLLLEGNIIDNDTENLALLDATKERFFLMTEGSTHFSHEAKPTSLLLSYLLMKIEPHISEWRNNTSKTFTPVVKPEVVSMSICTPTEREMAILSKRIDAIREMKMQGYHPCLVFYPTARITEAMGQKKDLHVLELCRYVAAETGIPLLNYYDAEFRDQLKFTDAAHLSSREESTSIFRNTMVRDAKKACGLK